MLLQGMYQYCQKQEDLFYCWKNTRTCCRISLIHLCNIWYWQKSIRAFKPSIQQGILTSLCTL